MQVRDIMTENPTCCSADTRLDEVARLMADNDCGEIPVVDEQGRPVGVVTDRDIACRAVAQGLDPKLTSAREVMSDPVVTASLDDSLEEVCARMEEHQIRRVPVVDEAGICCGMLSQADIARVAPERDTAELVRDISRPTRSASSQIRL
ncbi:MAG TPA: CBS domain-containing protein [Gammaproteobacteria bacterium]